jgi:hypothetical protein
MFWVFFGLGIILGIAFWQDRMDFLTRNSACTDGHEWDEKDYLTCKKCNKTLTELLE